MSEKNIERLWQTIRDPKLKTMVSHLGMEIDHIGTDGIRGTMPVDERTVQYYGMLHGGASVAFAETLASLGSIVHIDTDRDMIVGLEINANHLKSATSGRVRGEGKPVHIGRKTHVWSIELKNEEGKLLCISRCTIAVVPKKA